MGRKECKFALTFENKSIRITLIYCAYAEA